jgi:N-acetylneuraminate synthase
MLASKASPAYWDISKEPTLSQHELFKKYDSLEADDYRALAEHCRQVGVDFLSTPFDLGAVDLLAPLVPAFKVASADITNVPLLHQIARHRKPVLLSVGASMLTEVDLALGVLTDGGCGEIALLHCVLNYPTAYDCANLNVIEGLARAYPDRVIGYSDHTLPDPAMTVLTTAWLKGARVIEKHFTDDKTRPGNDHYHAMDADDLRALRRQLNLIATLGGQTEKTVLESEQLSRLNARRSIVIDRTIEAGTVLTSDVLTCKRPGTGISPVHWDEVLGCRIVRRLEADYLLRWDDLAP